MFWCRRRIRFSRRHTSLASSAFLDALAYDDEFRALLEAEPQRALAQYGIRVSSDLLPERFEVPTKEEVQAVFFQQPWPEGPQPRPWFTPCLCVGLAFASVAQGPPREPAESS